MAYPVLYLLLIFFPINSILCCLWYFNLASQMLNSNEIYLDDSVVCKRMASMGIIEWYKIPTDHTGMLKEKMWLMNNCTVASAWNLYNKCISKDGLLCHLHGRDDESPLFSRERDILIKFVSIFSEWIMHHLMSLCLEQHLLLN